MSSDPQNEARAPLWSERYGEHYHDRHGAQAQAEHVFLHASGTSTHPRPHVIEVGFGLGLNFLTTLADALRRDVPLAYLAIEQDPVPREVLCAQALQYPQHKHPVWQALLSIWPRQVMQVQLANIRLEVRIEDATRTEWPRAWASAIYLDGFSPAVNPELWTDSFIERLAAGLAPAGVLTTYSAAGRVRRALTAAGLHTTREKGHAHKREFLRAQKSA